MLLSLSAGTGVFDQDFLSGGFSIGLAQEADPKKQSDYKERCPGVYVYQGRLSKLTPEVVKNDAGDVLDGILCQNFSKAVQKFLTEHLAELSPRFLCFQRNSKPALAFLQDVSWTPVKAGPYLFGFSAGEKAAAKLVSGFSEKDNGLTIVTALGACLSGGAGAPSVPDPQKEEGTDSVSSEDECTEEDPVSVLQFKGHTFTEKEKKRLHTGLSVFVDSRGFRGDVLLLQVPGKRDKLYGLPVPDQNGKYGTKKKAQK